MNRSKDVPETQNPLQREALPSPLRWVVALHRRLLPRNPDIGWTPYLWLFYLSMPIWSWYQNPPSVTVLILGLVSLVVFLALYFNGYWRKGPNLLWNVSGILLIGLIWTAFNPSALVFFIYAAGFTGFLGSVQLGRRVLLAIAFLVVIFGLTIVQHFAWTVLTVCLCGMIGATNIYYAALSAKNKDLKRSREEVQRLAALAERERISRDLHDLLGHTLSVITLKSELARKLTERGDERAAQEIAEVEQISRDALRQVRQAVEGIRKTGFAGELARAQLVCEARDIDLSLAIETIELDTRQEAVLSMVLREAVTNLVRHSQASRAEISLTRTSSDITLKVHDDGEVASSPQEGHGLRGMRERLAEHGGRLEIETNSGWNLEAHLPSTATVDRILDTVTSRDAVSPHDADPLPEPNPLTA